MEKITVDSILEWLRESVEQKRPIDAHTWVDACQKLNILSEEEIGKLYDLQQVIARLKYLQIQNGDSVAKAKVYIETTDEYKEMKKLEAKIDLIQESIRIAKIQARLTDGNIQSY